MREDREHQADRAVGQQLGRHARADHLDAAVLDLVAERARAPCATRGLLRLLAARLLRRCGSARRSAPPNCCSCTSPRPSPLERRAHLREIGRPGLRLHLDQRAADEVDAEIQAVDRRYSTIATIDSSADIGKLMRRKRMKSNLVSSGTIRRSGMRAMNAHGLFRL